MPTHARNRFRPGRRPAAVAALAVAATTAAIALSPLGAGATASSSLVRYPYLTDLTSTSVQVTFDTTVKVTSANGAVRWGTPSGTTGCTLTGSSATSTNNSVNAPITVNGTTEYQTSIRISGLTSGSTYCYRVYTGGSSPVDLLGTDTAPRFTTLSTSSTYTFDVLGDWGDNSIANGLGQQNVDALLANSGAQFAVSTGDIAYQTGTQTQYGNLVATGAGVSQVFGPSYWKSVGDSIPLFSTTGNHGRSLTFLQNWKQAATVAASSGKYVMETYSGLDGTTSASYPSVWYAFNAGNARFYILNADWNDNNVGTAPGGAYQVDRDYHWQTSSPEYKWLKADLASHSSTLKFAFFHYPLRSDSATEASDSFLQNDPNTPTSISNLEGLLANSGVNLAFNGHAHLYQRNVAPPGGLTSYVTGGGGAKISPVNKSACSPTDAYAVGWAYTSAAGSACGAAPTPTSDAQVFHYLKVSVSGTSVTVTPTDSTGHTFDVMTYNFKADSTAPTAPTGLLASAIGSTVKLSWNASSSTDVSAQDVYRNGSWLGTVPVGQLSLVDTAPVAGASYTVRAHDLRGNQSPDSAPASVGSGSDTSKPTIPTGVSATATGPTSIKVSWSASTDNVGVTGYQIFRDGAATPLTTVAGSVLSYVDNTVAAQSTHSYTVQATDAAGNLSGQSSPPASATTPSGGGGGEVTFAPTDDVTLDSTVPTTPANPTGTRLSADGSPINDVIIQFNVQNLPTGCVISNATLQLTVGTSVNNNSVSGGSFYGTTNATWLQSNVTWNSSPQSVGSPVGSLGAVALGETVTMDVTSLVSGTGFVTFRIKNTSGDAAAYYSKEGSATLGPQLQVTC
ncbi:MAG TPA: DNRLRE domain-containing protein [Jatrophihabitans sp.]|nr:DNRLRE domain-containing protein [Jatrophihabitans sp.]